MSLINSNNLMLVVFLILATCTIQSISRTIVIDDSFLGKKHQEWMVKHARVYANDAEKENRFKIFKDNWNYIEKFNSEGNKTYSLGINQFSDLTPEEFQQRYTTTLFYNYSADTCPWNNNNKCDCPCPSPTTPPTPAPVVPPGTIPSSIDWREKGAITPPVQQGSCGSCWAFAAIASIESMNYLTNGKLVKLSPQQLLDCVEEGAGCRGGWTRSAYKYAMHASLTTLENYPYVGYQRRCRSHTRTKDDVRLSGYESIRPRDEEALNKAVAKNPVAIPLCGGPIQHYSSGIVSYDGNCASDHEIQMIGYGTDSRTGHKYWLAKNSWGEQWGENGYVRFLRGVDTYRGLGVCKIYGGPHYPVVVKNEP